MSDLKQGDVIEPPVEHPMTIVEISPDGERYKLEWTDDRWPGKTFNLWVTEAQLNERFRKPH